MFSPQKLAINSQIISSVFKAFHLGKISNRKFLELVCEKNNAILTS